MPGAHIHGHLRACGATTVVENQGTVYVNGQLWAVDGDPNTHGNGDLIASGTTVFIENKPVIVNNPDTAEIDDLGHVATDDETAQGSSDVFAYGA